MIRIQFQNKKSFYEAEFIMINENTVKLTGSKIRANTSGFKAFRLNGEFLGDYSEYIKCKETEGGFLFMKK